MSCIQRLASTGNPKVDGPHAWAQIHDGCNRLSNNCECKEMCVNLTRAMHDLVNWHLQKPIHYRGNLQKMAGFYQKAAFGCRGPNCA